MDVVAATLVAGREGRDCRGELRSGIDRAGGCALLRSLAGADLFLASAGRGRDDRSGALQGDAVLRASGVGGSAYSSGAAHRGGAGAMEIRLSNGTAIVVGNDVSEEALVRVLAALGR